MSSRLFIFSIGFVLGYIFSDYSKGDNGSRRKGILVDDITGKPVVSEGIDYSDQLYNRYLEMV
jgi:hypothetical protein